LAKRGFNAESIQRFQIGFAPDAWDTLLRSPLARKFPPALLHQAGLIKPRAGGDGFYDTFRNRVMFPIRDENGRVIAFGGRVMPGSEDPAKYLNSPETPLFSKGRSIFGLDLARQRVVETRSVAVVEGYTDVVMAHQYGVTNVVSILGTAMTEQHVNILRRFADRIVLLFDADVAGETAATRTVELFMTQPVDFAIAAMPQGVDPDEFLLAHGGEGFRKLLDDAPPVLQFMVRQFKRRWSDSDGNIPAQERALQGFMEPFVRAKAERAVDPNRWAAVIATVSKEIGVPTEELHRRYGKEARKVVRRAVPGPGRVPPGEPPRTAGPRPLLTAQARAERQVLGLLLVEPTKWHEVQRHVDVTDFTDDLRRRLAEAYWTHQRDEGEPVFNEFLSDLRDETLRELAIELVEEVESLRSSTDLIAEAVLHLEEQRRRREEQKLTARLRRTNEQLGEQDEILVLRKLSENAAQPNIRRGA
jgi:DNA primase